MVSYGIIIFMLLCTVECAVLKSPAQSCNRCAADVAFVIDDSSAVAPSDFDNYIKPFVISVINGLGVSKDGAHVSLVQYSDMGNTLLISYLNESFDSQSIASRVIGLTFKGGDASLHSALYMTYTATFSSYRGARNSEWGQAVAPYVFVITSGLVTDRSKGDPEALTYKMLQSGIAVFAIGIGNLPTRDFLNGLTYDSSRAYMANDVSMLTTPEFVNRVLGDSCCPNGFLKPTPPPPAAYCDAVDLMFVIDESLPMSADPKNFEILQEHMLNITSLFTIAYDNTRVAVVGYGRDVKMFFRFNDLNDHRSLRNRIKAMEYLGGARNVADALNVAFQEIRKYSRQSLGLDIPTYLIHISQYAHDAGDDPVNKTQIYRQYRTTIFAETILEFKDDSIFKAETDAILRAGTPDSKLFTAKNFKDLFNSGLREHLDSILRNKFPCKK